MYVLTVEDSFAAAHQLRGYRGKCENIHGHNWKVVLEVQGKKLNETGLLIDFHELKAILKTILSYFDHQNINDLPPFTSINPSSENLSRYVAEKTADELQKTGKEITVKSVTIWESDTSRCTFYP
ncbi:MAG TPA: 6-carboxytetrahydropterin synthase QueD [Spirochaetota bacterium]|nr:6-carboxytetrahydropterin synthase QueD [Spirochaetota bacterium]HPI90259.1 6-carboxytetrahydropterin synthase QueD [Spirochaetota bacterium]HPR46500.1 6-carboxytetrahydropterin synthase QueD [Spirochaetota bacterium]